MSAAPGTGVDWSGALVVSAVAFEVGWQRCGLGETPWQLDPPRAGRTPDERARVVAEAEAELCDRGGDGRWLRERMSLLADPRRGLDVRYLRPDLVAAVVAVRDRRAVLAVRRGQEIAVVDVAPADAALALVDLPGPLRPGPGVDVTVPAAALDAARQAITDRHLGGPAASARFVAALLAHGVDQQDADAVVAMSRDVLVRGQLGATAYDRDGRARRSGRVVGFHRTPAGDYRQIRRGAAVVIGPVGRTGLADELLDLATAGG